jgi:hypothetical protein
MLDGRDGPAMHNLLAAPNVGVRDKPGTTKLRRDLSQ